MKSFLMSWAYRGARLSWRLTRPTVIGVRILMIQQQQVVLVHHTNQDDWYLPGGSVKRFELPADAARREVSEEVGGEIRNELQLFGIYASFVEHKNDHIVTFLCDDFKLKQRSDQWEIEAVAVFDINCLPPDVSPATQRRIDEYCRGSAPYHGTW